MMKDVFICVSELGFHLFVYGWGKITSHEAQQLASYNDVES